MVLIIRILIIYDYNKLILGKTDDSVLKDNQIQRYRVSKCLLINLFIHNKI